MRIINQFLCPDGQSYTDADLMILYLLDIREEFQQLIHSIRLSLQIPYDGFNWENHNQITSQQFSETSNQAYRLVDIYNFSRNWVTTFYFIILFGFSVPPKWTPVHKIIKVYDAAYTTNDPYIIELFGMIKTPEHLEKLLSVVPNVPRTRINKTTIKDMSVILPLLNAGQSVSKIAEYIENNPEKVSLPVVDEEGFVDEAKLNAYITRFKKYKNIITERYIAGSNYEAVSTYQLAFTRFILQYS